MKLCLSEDLKLPIDYVTETTAIVARKRVGKTYTGSVICEELIEAKIPICVLDPTGAWWGLRSSADGKSEGYPVIIIGGSHADVPLDEHAGKIIADLIVDHPGFYIVDFTHFESDAAVVRFATDFAKRFYFRKEQNRFPIHLIVDEADVFMPQQPFENQKHMLGAFDTIVRRGGIRGIGITMITQRPAVLNKNVLTQAGNLIALSLTGSQDVDAIEHWMRIHASKEQQKEFLSTVGSLQTGEAWFWSPSWLQVFKRIKVRQRRTFNSSATPKAGEKQILPAKLAAVDIDKLGEQIKQAAQAIKENDPKELQAKLRQQNAQITKLEKDITHFQNARANNHVVDHSDEVRKLKKSLEAAMRFIVEINTRNFGPEVDSEEITAAISAAVARATSMITGKVEQKNFELKRLKERAEVLVNELKGTLSKDVTVQVEVKHNEPDAVQNRPVPMARPIRNVPPPNPMSNGDVSPKGQQILNALAEMELLKTNQPERELIALLAGYTNLSSKGFVNAVCQLRTLGLIDYPNSESMQLTDNGRDAASYPAAPRSAEEIQQRICSMLGGKSELILKTVIEAYPNAVLRTDVAGAAGYTNLSSKGFVNTVCRLRTLGFVDYPDKTTMIAKPILFLA